MLTISLFPLFNVLLFMCMHRRYSLIYRESEPERACLQLIPYLLSEQVIEKLLSIAFAAEDQYIAYNIFAILSRVFWTSLPSGSSFNKQNYE